MILEYIREKIQSMQDLRLRKTVVDRQSKKVFYTFSFPVTLSQDTRDAILRVAKEHLPAGFACNCQFEKDSADVQPVRRYFFNYLAAEHPALHANRTLFEVTVTDAGTVRMEFHYEIKSFVIEIKIDAETENMLKKLNFVPLLARYYASVSAHEFKFSVRVFEREVSVEALVAKSQKKLELSEERALSKPRRYISVSDVSLLFGKKIAVRPKYICDVDHPMQSCTVCGVLSKVKANLSEKIQKTIFKFELTDFTGTIFAVLFSTASQEAVFSRLEEGAQLMAAGRVSYNDYSHRLELVVYSLALCRILTTSQPRQDRLPETSYTTVFPRPYARLTQNELFDSGKPDANVPKGIAGGETIVVFDTISTDKNIFSGALLEIAAVKITGGVIIETIDTVLAAETELTDELTEETGITAKKLSAAPAQKQAAPDFYKFFHGAKIATFSPKTTEPFLKQFFESAGYELQKDAEIIDISELARAALSSQNMHVKSISLIKAASKLKVPPSKPINALSRALCAAQFMLAFGKTPQSK